MTTTYVGDGTTANVFVAKYDNKGNLIWVQLLGVAGSSSIAYGAAVDTNSPPNVYLTGKTSGTASLAGGAGSVFVAKYNNSGQRQWVSQFGSTGASANDHTNAITVDPSGNPIVVGGTYIGLTGFTNAGPDASGNITSDIFVAKFNPSGGAVWLRQYGTPNNDDAWGVTTDSLGNVFVTGYTYGNMDGNVGTGLADIFGTKFDSAGNKLATVQFGSTQVDVGMAAAVFVGPNGTPQNPEEFIYVAGYTFGDLDKNLNMNGGGTSGSYTTSDYFLIKYNAVTGEKF
jgi:hypothetical protein